MKKEFVKFSLIFATCCGSLSAVDSLAQTGETTQKTNQSLSSPESHTFVKIDKIEKKKMKNKNKGKK